MGGYFRPPQCSFKRYGLYSVVLPSSLRHGRRCFASTTPPQLHLLPWDIAVIVLIGEDRICVLGSCLHLSQSVKVNRKVKSSRQWMFDLGIKDLFWSTKIKRVSLRSS